MAKPVVYKTCIDLLPHLPGMHYLEVPPTIIKKLGGTFKARLICTVNKKITYQCGLMALGKGSGYITISGKRMKELGVTINDEVSVSLVPDDSKYGVEMPEELGELLNQDPEGDQRFKALVVSKQRYIIHHVLGVKSSRLRIERAILLIENLKKQPLGKENFRAILGLPPR